MNDYDESMDLQQMRYVVAVAEEQSFTRAAERCFVVQSALSHQIKALEREIGVQLFARTSRRVELTAAGEAFLAAARVSLDAAKRAVADAAAADGQVRGELTIGVIPTVTAIDVPSVLGMFREQYPAVYIKLRTGGSERFIADIASGQLDIAMLGLAESARPEGVAFRELAREQLVAVMPETHALAQRKRIRLQDLAGEVFVDFPSASAGRAQTDSAFQAAGLERDVAFEAMTIDLMCGLIEQGLAVALLSPRAIPRHARVAAVQVTDGPRRVEYLAWSDFNQAPAARAFLECISGHYVGF
ncbi:MAG: LysR family transcriptional regulator [Corynebacterium sp.]|nr:LysR family transcriptional regulator [Corynebacterium sp.]